MRKFDSLDRNVPIAKDLRLHGTIAHNIGIAILSGAYRSNDHLSNEIVSSGKLGVSRSAYREALRILAAKGLVECKPKTGTRVCPKRKWHLLDTDVLAWVTEVDLNSELFYYLLELRDIVDSSAAALAATRRSEAHLNIMRYAINTMRQYPVVTEIGRRAGRDFLDTLLQATANPYVSSLAASIDVAVNAASNFKQCGRAVSPNAVSAHTRVFQAIADMDPINAKNAMSELVRLPLQGTSLLRPPSTDQRTRRSA
ncbi:MAG: FadR family transcriptional regulator [Alphaproteobacteria bacterium]|nr:FadR family transcriptional regulator [Alphaproteobacteria bacterium]